MRKPNGKASFRGQKKSGGDGVRKPIGDLPNSVEPSIINQPGGKRAQDGKESFKGQKKTGRVGVMKPIGKASFRGQKKSGGAGVRKPIGDLPNSGEPPVTNQPGEKKAQDGPLTSGKQLKSNELANLKEEAVPSEEKGVVISFYEKTRHYREFIGSEDTTRLYNFTPDELFDSD